MEKKNIPVKVWLFLVSSILCLGIGIVLLAQYSIEVSDIKSVMTEELKKTSWDIDYTYTTHSGESKTIGVYDFQLDDDDLFTDIMNDIHSETWVTIHKTFSKVLIAIGVILFIAFVIQLLKCIEGDGFIGILKLPSIGFVIGCLICWWGTSMLGTSETEAERSMHHGQGDPRFYGGLFLIVGIGIACFAIYMASKAISRYRLAKYNPEEYKQLVEKEKAQAQANAAAHQAMLDAERDAAINGTPGAPWETQYLPHPCPYCHRYKVRYIKWEDKRASVYFWGRMSSKIGTHYICDNCKKTWE